MTTTEPDPAPSATETQRGAPLSSENVLRAMTATGFEYTDNLWWRTAQHGEHLAVFADCSDVFAWSSADVEEVTDANIDALLSCYAECEAIFGRYQAIWAGALFCARQRHAPVQPAFAALVGREPRWTLLFTAAAAGQT